MAGPEGLGLVKGVEWGVEKGIPSIFGKKSRKKIEIFTRNGSIFVPVLNMKMMNLPPEVVICWMLKMRSCVLSNFRRDLTYCHQR